jgi:hypothetical protein
MLTRDNKLAQAIDIPTIIRDILELRVEKFFKHKFLNQKTFGNLNTMKNFSVKVSSNSVPAQKPQQDFQVLHIPTN